ncbi:MAG TPA: hypothetical protein PKD45_01425 [Flavobacteriales bacterium]|nr:hypothetical protein [Flavobacteriales bacterium]
MRNFASNILRATAGVACILALGTGAKAQNTNIAVNETGAVADPKAMLDISSITKGLLIPRMGTLPPPAALPDGLVVFRTTAPRIFHVVDNGNWRPLFAGNHGWDIFGNFLTNNNNPNPDYIGTSDNRPMYFRTNNLHRMQMDATTGFLAVGYAQNAAGAAKEQLDINGALGMYYEPSLTAKNTSNTSAAGVIRYQPYGAVTGSVPYRYGSMEMAPTIPNTAATQMSVYGTNKTYPLQYAAHWGNVNGKDTVSGHVIGTAPPTIIQPSLGGWRALENNYEEVFGASWSHFKEVTCTPNTTVDIPNGNLPAPGATWSNNAALGADGPRVTPYHRQWAPNTFVRRQYLFFASELNAEVAQSSGNPGANGGLCAGQPVTKIGFRVNASANRPFVADQAHVIVRNAPLGLNELNGFDNSVAGPGMGCGAVPPANWPDATGDHWHMIPLTTPFVWDGESNVIVEVAVRMGPTPPPTNTATPPVLSSQQSVNVTYAMTTNSYNTSNFIPSPHPGPGWACSPLLDPAAGNTQLLMPDLLGGMAQYGASTWRPIVRFEGTVGVVPPVTTPGGTSRYINYPGALILEDTTKAAKLNTMSSGFPWGQWRIGFPTGYTTFNYKGKGTISAQNGVYDNTVRLNDHVFDRAFDGRVAPQDAAEHGNNRLLSIEEMATFTSQNRHLPTMKGREEWNQSQGFSLGDLTNQLWTTAETHALYVADLHDKLNVLEILASDRPLNTGEYQAACRQLAIMPQYSDAEKQRLIEHLRQRTPTLPPTR